MRGFAANQRGIGLLPALLIMAAIPAIALFIFDRSRSARKSQQSLEGALDFRILADQVKLAASDSNTCATALRGKPAIAGQAFDFVFLDGVLGKDTIVGAWKVQKLTLEKVTPHPSIPNLQQASIRIAAGSTGNALDRLGSPVRTTDIPLLLSTQGATIVQCSTPDSAGGFCLLSGGAFDPESSVPCRLPADQLCQITGSATQAGQCILPGA